jgi:NAD(P)-dependent dehydrogenase (short-subunit alcohol dehydrogenase family)
VITLTDKSIVVIGGTSGIGLSAAAAFINAGAKVVVVGKDAEKLEAAKAKLGSSAMGLAADATNPDTARAAINIAVKNFGGFHGLYHVAGGSGRKEGDGPLHLITDDGWDYTLRSNLTALFYSNRAAAQHFVQHKTRGSVLNMSSVLGFSPSPHYFATHAYAAAKAAIIGFTKSSAAYYAPAGIRFNVLAPALVATPMSQRAQSNAEVLDFIATKQPLDGGRIGKPSDLDAAAAYFLSDDSKFVTGQVLAVDGGWSVSEGQLPLPPSPTRAQPQPQSPGLVKTLAKWWVKMSSK